MKRMLRSGLGMGSKWVKFGLLVLIPIAIFWILTVKNSYFSIHAITYDKYNRPLIATEMGGRSYTLIADIGSRFPLFLTEEELEDIDKKANGFGHWHNIRGEQCSSPSYVIPRIKIGDIVLNNVIANQDLVKSAGRLGKFLGGDHNLLLDFPNDRIIACNTFSKLESKKLVDKTWISVPFETVHESVVFSIDTIYGIRKFMLNSAVIVNSLRSSIVRKNVPNVFSFFTIGDHDFGNFSLEPIELPEGLEAIDGFIGMDFLKDHAVYLDCTHKIAYFEPPKDYFARIPITFSKRNAPLIDVSIENKTYPFIFDSGSSFAFSIREEIMQNFDKLKCATSKWYDLKGHQYESPAYMIPEIKIGDFQFFYPLAQQDNEKFHENVTFDGPTVIFPGAIGRPLIEKYNLFLDFPHSAVYTCRNHLRLQKEGLLSQNLLIIPFSNDAEGIILSVATDEGTFKLVLDTGSTFTILRAPHSSSTERFEIMGHDFGRLSIKVLEISTQCPFDGIIGMDFLMKHPMFIDYLNRQIYLDLQ